MHATRRLDTGLLVVRPARGEPVRDPSATLVLLHGHGEYHDQLLDPWSAQDVGCSVLAVRSSFRIGPGAYRWFAYEDLPDGSVAIARNEELHSREALVAFLREHRGAAPGRRTYLFGHSQGGMMALSVAILAPDLVDGCAVVNGRVLPETLAQLSDTPRLDGTPVFLAHGTEDQVVPVRKGRAARELLLDMGAELDYREYDGGHEITTEVVADAAAWLRVALGTSVIPSYQRACE